ncbi:TetR/AcrR family transcriptional regulator [Plantibacter flavus]|uniref:TetR/AcrR family transcriptional regulator n=1 Tax=Plantibacter flavus TaxID=150123 RepID=UPI003F13D668
MDPRQARTRRSLRDAIYVLAAEKPIEQVTVAEVARAASITRDTFYRHAPTPVHLLADFLGEELDEFLAAHADLPDRSDTELSVFDESERDLLQHVAGHATIYRNAMSPRLVGPLRDALINRIENALTHHLTRHPHIAPMREAGISPERHARMLVAYAGTGTVGAIEEWLLSGDLDDIDAAARTIIAASPGWWLGRHPTP